MFEWIEYLYLQIKKKKKKIHLFAINFKMSECFISTLHWFLDPSEASTPPILTSSRTPSTKSYHSGVPSPPIMPSEADGFSFSTVSNVSNVSNVNRLRSSSMTGADYSENVPKGSKPKLKHTFSDNIFSVKK